MKGFNNFTVLYRDFRARGIGSNGQMLYEANIKATVGGGAIRHETADGNDVWDAFAAVISKILGLPSDSIRVVKKRVGTCVGSNEETLFQVYATLENGGISATTGKAISAEVNDAIFQAIIDGLRKNA